MGAGANRGATVIARSVEKAKKQEKAKEIT
jgi:hypothetical protein